MRRRRGSEPPGEHSAYVRMLTVTEGKLARTPLECQEVRNHAPEGRNELLARFESALYDSGIRPIDVLPTTTAARGVTGP